MSLMDEDHGESLATVVIPATLVSLVNRLRNVKYGQRVLLVFTSGKVPDWSVIGEGKIEHPAEGAEAKHYEGQLKVTKRNRS